MATREQRSRDAERRGDQREADRAHHRAEAEADRERHQLEALRLKALGEQAKGPQPQVASPRGGLRTARCHQSFQKRRGLRRQPVEVPLDGRELPEPTLLER